MPDGTKKYPYPDKKQTAGHAGIACFSFALKGNRAGSPHFKIVRFKWWEHVTLTLVDDSHIYVGDYTMIGPNVTIATAGHPILPELREKGYQYNMEVHIGKNCWLGAGVVVLPGVTIGDNVVVGAGSIVTKDIPSNVVAVGNPCKVLREVNERDREYYFKDRKIDYAEIV